VSEPLDAEAGGDHRVRPGPDFDRGEAQRRVDRIHAFREELAELERQGVLARDQRERVLRFHEDTVRALAARFDVDASEAERRLSLGMRTASLLGAITLAAAAYTFVERFWWGLPVVVQVALLVAAPLLCVAGMEVAARRERTLYVTGVLGLVALAFFAVDLDAIGALFNVTPGPGAFLAWAAFAGLLAHAYGLRLLLFAAGAGFTVFLSARVTEWMGGPWGQLGSRPESVLPPAALLLAAGVVLSSRAGPALAPVYRLSGLCALLLSVFALSQGATSQFPWRAGAVEAFYQVVFVLVAGLALRTGIRRGWPEVEAVATVFLVLFLLARFVDWCWDWMPRWLFFLALGALALGVLFALRRLRRARQGVAR